MQRRTKAIIALLLLSFLFIADLLTGSLAMPGWDVVRLIRIPRVLTATLSGASLALAGLLMQSIFRNPLCDPHIMGISSASGLSVAICVSTAPFWGVLSGSFALFAAASIGAALASLLIIAVAGKTRNATTLLLFGVMAGFLFSAITTMTGYNAAENSLKIYYNWSAGSFSTAGYSQIAIIAAALAIGTSLAAFCHKGLDLSLFGDQYTILSGGNPSLTRFIAISGSCILTGAVTSVCGPLGFIGIAAPHIARKLFGSSLHRITIPSSLICGACISLAADFLSQTLGKVLSLASILPVGSTLALLGAPVILLIILKKDNAGI